MWLYGLQEIPKFMRSSEDSALWVMLSEPGLGLAGTYFFFSVLAVLWAWTH